VRELHRTSLWSQLYGRATFSRFAAHPKSWASDTPLVAWLGRLMLVLALPPAALLAIGMARRLAGLARGLLRGTELDPGESFLTLLAWGQLALVVLYALRFRDFSGMKEIFLFPALLAYAAFLAGELDRLAHAGRAAWVARTVLAAGVLLVGLDVVDVGLLIADLAAQTTT
jgi:hypothetical protein